MLTSYSNVFVGISLANKTLTPQGVKYILDFAASEFECRRLVFLVADQLNLINLRVFESGSHETLSKKVYQESEMFIECIKEGIASWSGSIAFVDIITWNQILDRGYWDAYMKIFSQFIQNTIFQKDIEDIARKFARGRGKGDDMASVHYLSTYLISELPTLLEGIRYKNKIYSSMVYPTHHGEAMDEIAKEIVAGRYGLFHDIEYKCQIKHLFLSSDGHPTSSSVIPGVKS